LHSPKWRHKAGVLDASEAHEPQHFALAFDVLTFDGKSWLRRLGSIFVCSQGEQQPHIVDSRFEVSRFYALKDWLTGSG
jgi:hypothetical protein